MDEQVVDWGETAYAAGGTVHLYAVWMNHVFGDSDTRIRVVPDGKELYIASGEIAETDQLGKQAAIKYD